MKKKIVQDKSVDLAYSRFGKLSPGETLHRDYYEFNNNLCAN